MADIDDLSYETDEVVAAEEQEDTLFENVSSIVSFVTERFNRAEDARQADEERWLRAYRNYRGIYGPDVQFTSSEKSKVFVKVTKTKALAAYGQIVDVLFGNNKFPLSVDPTVLPDGVAESVHINLDPNAEKATDELSSAFTNGTPKPYLIGPDTKLQPGETMSDLRNRLGPLSTKLDSVSDKIVEGEGTGPTTVEIKAGTPLAHLIPLTERPVQLRVHHVTEAEFAQLGEEEKQLNAFFSFGYYKRKALKKDK